MPEGNIRIGFFANEVENNIPKDWGNLVNTIKMPSNTTSSNGIASNPTFNDIKTLDYSRLTAVLFSVCKNLDRRITELENKLNQ